MTSVDGAEDGARAAKARRILIIHMLEDERVAAALVAVVKAAFEIEDGAIGCVVVQNLAPLADEYAAEALISDLNDIGVVVGLWGPSQLGSSTPAFELGIAWGRGLKVVTMIIRGEVIGNIPAPLRGHCLVLRDPDAYAQLLDLIAQLSALPRRQERAEALREHSERLIAAATERRPMIGWEDILGIKPGARRSPPTRGR